MRKVKGARSCTAVNCSKNFDPVIRCNHGTSDTEKAKWLSEAVLYKSDRNWACCWDCPRGLQHDAQPLAAMEASLVWEDSCFRVLIVAIALCTRDSVSFQICFHSNHLVWCLDWKWGWRPYGQHLPEQAIMSPCLLDVEHLDHVACCSDW